MKKDGFATVLELAFQVKIPPPHALRRPTPTHKVLREEWGRHSSERMANLAQRDVVLDAIDEEEHVSPNKK